MKTCHLEKDTVFMFLLQKISVLHYRQADFQSAIDYTNRAISLAKETVKNHSSDLMALVENYYNLSFYYEGNGQLEKKYDAIDSCIAYSLKGGREFTQALDVLSDKTDYLFNKGEYSLCSIEAKMGEEITERYFHGKDSMLYIVYFVIKQATALYFFKNFPPAEKLLEEKIPQFIKTGNSDQLYAIYYLLGLINNEKEIYSKALSYFKQAYKASSLIKFRPGCAQHLTSIGTLYAKNLNKYDIGLKYCADALKYADKGIDSFPILQQTGSIYVLKGMYDKAQDFFQQAFNTVQPGMNETTMLLNSFQFPTFNLLQNLSDLTTAKGDAFVEQYYKTKNESYLKKALNTYKKCDLFLAKIKTDQQLQLNSNLVWRTTARNLYEHAIEACYANKNIEDAFYFFEKSRAVLLNDQINEQRWMADEDILSQTRIKKTIIELERTLANLSPASEEYLAVNNKLSTSYKELGVLVRKIKSKNSLFYQSYLDTVFMNVKQLRKNILTNSKTLVEIFSGDNAMYVLTIASNNQSITKINKKTYDSLIHLYNSLITKRGLLNKNFQRFIKTAHQLYLLLFQDNTLPDGSIIISPDGASYPFEALVMNEDGMKPDYFLNHYATSYTYSVKYLTNQFTVNSNSSSSVLGIAPVKYKNSNLTTLDGSDKSLKNINTYFGNATNYFLEKATKNNFLQNFPRYNIIQLYTHAADSSTNNDPVIYFADSILYLSELLTDRKPVTQLVVLSACETANGKLYQGEGIFSFNRGFAALGIPAAVSTLWSVDNESTYRITELFYKYLSQDLPTDIALQKAKLEFINTSSSREYKSPYFWAGPILTGKVDKIKNSTGFPWKEFSGAAVLLLCIGYFTKKHFE